MSNAPPYGLDVGRCVAFDVEVYPGRWCVGFLGPAADGRAGTRVVDGDRDELARVLDELAGLGRTLVSYNGDHFDVPVIRATLGGLDPYAVGTAIIDGGRAPAPVPPLPCDHVDLAARLRRGGGFPSLKKVAAYLGRPTLRELPFAPGTPLSDEQWEEVKRYNAVDLGHTRALLERFAPELEALASLSGELGQDLRSTPTPKVVERVFLAAYRREHGAEPVRPEPPHEVVYRPPAGVRRPRTPEAAAWYDRVVDRPLPMVARGDRSRPEVPHARFRIGRTEVSVGSGGLHSVDRPRVHYATRKRRLVSVDVASYYPSLIAAKGITPRSYGECGAATYRGILETRLEVKRLARAAGDPAERRRLDVQANALKLVLNSTFGKLGDPYSTLFDPAALLAVTLTGQLMLIDLIERLAGAGARVISANTDGLFLAVRRDDRRWREVLEAWEADTGMSLEVDPLKRLAILASNRFAALDARGKVKRKGAGVKGDLSPTAAPNALVVADALADALLADVPPEVTIRECSDPVRFCSVTQRSGKVEAAVLVDAADGSEVELPRIARWYRARDSSRRIVHRFASGKATTPANADGVALALDLTPGRLPADLDLGWYVERARRAVQSVPGYRHRSRRRLGGHAPALEAHARGLAPAPKWRGKAQARGSDRGIATYLWDWPRYPTVGTYTGPSVGILVLDVDDAVRFKAWVDRGNSPLFRDRWRDIDGCLVSCRGDATPGQVRSGRARGKLIFRLEGDGSHPLARMRQARWLPTRGVEVFYGHGIPSVLGEHPDGTAYRLDGTLGEAPDWLIAGLIPPRRLPGEQAEPGRPDPDPAGPAEAEVDPARLEGLPGELAGLAPELGRPSVGWRTKGLGDGRTIWVGTCPFEHDSGARNEGDLWAGYGDDGRPYVRCKHASCAAIPEIDARLKRAARPAGGRAAEPPPIEPTAIARAMLADLAAGRVARHHAATGAGKTYSMAQAAALRWRANQATLIALPTVRLAEETVERLREFAPDAFEAGAVATIYGRRPASPDENDGDDDDDGDEDCGEYPIDGDVRVVVCTHAQLGRRGFSRFVRGIWEKLAPDDRDQERPVFSLIIDEAGEFLRQCRWEIPLAHRVKGQNDPDGSGGWLIPQDRCPMATRSGNCGNCHLVKHGGNPRFNRFGIRELRPPPRIEVGPDGAPLYHPRSPLVVTGDDLARGQAVRVGHTTFASEVRAWRGRPIDDAARRAAPTYIFRRDRESGLQPPETPAEVLGHLLEFAHRPVVTWEFAVDGEGSALSGEELAALRAADENRWHEGITFPHRTCDSPRLLLTDLLALEKVRRHAAAHGAGVVLAGATFGPGDAAVLRAVWPGLVDREHPYPDRKVDRVAIVAPRGYHGGGALLGPDGRLVTAPLEAAGKGLVFCATKRTATALYECVSMRQPGARLAVENHLQLSTRKTLHDGDEAPLGTYVTYSRGVLGLGANVLHLRHLIVDANAFRAVGSFNPGEITPEVFERDRAAERTALILQNVGRALRGERGKTVALIVLNAADDPLLLEELASNPAIVQGSERPPVVATGEDLPQMVDQARRWLEAGGGDWPDPDPARARPRGGGRRPRKTREDVLAAAEEALRDGETWKEFSRKHHPRRQLDAEELDALRKRFAEARSPK